MFLELRVLPNDPRGEGRRHFDKKAGIFSEKKTSRCELTAEKKSFWSFFVVNNDFLFVYFVFFSCFFRNIFSFCDSKCWVKYFRKNIQKNESLFAKKVFSFPGKFVFFRKKEICKKRVFLGGKSIFFPASVHAHREFFFVEKYRHFCQNWIHLRSVDQMCFLSFVFYQMCF